MRPLHVAAAALIAASAAALAVAFHPPRPAAVAPASAIQAEVPPVRPPGRARRGGMDVTFLVTSDTHMGYSGAIAIPDHPEGVGVEKVHEIVVRAMNGIPGTPFPSGIGGVVGEPRGVLVAGDITETGQRIEFDRFEAIYGLTGKDGWLHYPVFEGEGNHDVWGGTYVKARIAERHGAARYSWDWDDLHLVCLGEAPNAADLAWLRDDLAATGPDVGVVIFFHYPLKDADTYWFGAGPFRDDLARILSGYRVLGIFNGHRHVSGLYPWRGYDAYLEGSVKHAWHSFSVVHVTDTRFTVASYNYDRRAFWWWHDKPIFGAPGEAAKWLSETDPLVGR